MATPVELKTLITVKLDEALVIPIEWKQDGQKKADYYSGTFTFGEQSGVIFVQKSKLEEFKGHLKDNQIEVNDKFQYGQEDSKGLGRWLVYHDKTNKPYQVSHASLLLIKDLEGSILTGSFQAPICTEPWKSAQIRRPCRLHVDQHGDYA